MRDLKFQFRTDLEDIFARPHQWKRITRNEALRIYTYHNVVVVVPAPARPHAQWLDRHHPSSRGNGPYRLDAFRFYIPISTHRATLKAAGSAPKSFGKESGASESEPERENKGELIPVLIAPDFISLDSGKEEPIRAIATNSTVYLKVDSRHLSLGDSIVFHLYRKGMDGKPDQKFDSIAGTVGQNRDDMCAVAKCILGTGSQGRKHENEDKIYFHARHAAKNLDVKSPDLNLKVKGRLVGFEMWCEHSKPDPKSGIQARLAKDGEVLCVVAAQADTDKVRLKARTEGKPEWVAWSGKGWKDFREDGEEIIVQVPGLEQMHWDFLPMAGIWGARIRPKDILVTAADDQGNRMEASIRVFPNQQTKISWDFTDELSGLAKLKALLEKFADNIRKIKVFPANFRIELLKGALSCTNEFKEDLKSSHVFVAVDLSAGFSPLAAAKLKFPIPIKGWADFVPPEMMEHLANIEAFGELYGKIDLKFSAGRSKYDDFNVQGGTKGALGLSVNMKVLIGVWKLLRIDCKAGTEISITTSLTAEGMASEDKFNVVLQTKSKFEGVTGSLSWVVLDGKWSRQSQWKFINPRELIESGKYKLFND